MECCLRSPEIFLAICFACHNNMQLELVCIGFNELLTMQSFEKM